MYRRAARGAAVEQVYGQHGAEDEQVENLGPERQGRVAQHPDGVGRGVAYDEGRDGSGGHELGEMLSRELNLKLYDREFIGMAAQRSGMDERYIIENEQSIPSFWLKCMFAMNNERSVEHGFSPDDVLFVAESRIVQELAERGEGLSAGEKQLISFARIIVKNPAVVILDEATSSISSDMEKLIQSALEVLLKGRTSFIVAHRLSTIRSADRILFIANKGIAEEGSHEQLMEKKGLYYELNKNLNKE